MFAGLVLALLVAAPSAQAAFSVQGFTTHASSDVAGAHGDVTTSFSFPDLGLDPLTHESIPDGHVSRIDIDMPPGLVGDPTAIPRCPRALFVANSCPPETQVGEAQVALTITGGIPAPSAVYNLTPSSSAPALLGIDIANTVIAYIQLSVRPNGALRATLDDLPYAGAVLSNELTLWGIPADHNGGGGPRRSFMVNPTSCDTPVTKITARSYEGVVSTATAVSPNPTGCDSLEFNPSIRVQPLNRTAGGTAPLDVDILVPQNSDPDGRAVAHLKKAVVVLPEGVSINPGQARDLTTCSDAAFNQSGTAPALCAASSKIGTVGIDTPLLADPIPGDIYLGDPQPGNMFRLFVYAAAHGVTIKLLGSAIPDPVTGRVTAVFDDNPPLPFTRFHLRFQGGNKSVLAMPATCGPKASAASLAPDSGRAASGVGDVFQIYADEAGSPCADPQPFAPSFVAGSTVPDAGADTGLSVTFGRGDQDQPLGALKLSLPAGMLGRLADFPACPTAAALANDCSDDSLVGSVVTSAGAGTSVLNLPGKVYLTAPWEDGQIAGLAFIVRAVAGPFDLGTVVVRAGIRVNPDTSLDVRSDPLPTILQGVPLRIRQVMVSVDRPGFMFNPSDCSPKGLTGSVSSAGGTEVPVVLPFQVGNCVALAFHPSTAVTIGAPAKDGGVTGLDVQLAGLPGEANMRSVALTLPSQLGARLEGPIQSPCTEEEFAADACPAASLVGRSSAVTPILTQPLSGSVYFLKATTGAIPRLAIRLKGPVTIDLIGDVSILPSGRILTTFPAIPDVPISSFDLTLDSGAQGILTSAKLCSVKPTADRTITAQNGRVSSDSVAVKVTGCATKRKGS
jgi:hypothetical protein